MTHQVWIDGSRAFLNVDDGGLHWLDPDGNLPKINKQGSLSEPFLLITFNADGTVRRREKWEPGTRLPLTPVALRLREAGQLTAADLVAVAGNSEGEEDMAVDQATPKVGTSKPAPKPSGKKKLATAIKRQAETNGKALGTAMTAGKVKGSATEKAAGAKAEGPSKPASGAAIYVRHMRSPRDAFILIKNPSVYGADSNWVTKDEFNNAKAAEAWAAKNGFKVANPSK